MSRSYMICSPRVYRHTPTRDLLEVFDETREIAGPSHKHMLDRPGRDLGHHRRQSHRPPIRNEDTMDTGGLSRP